MLVASVESRLVRKKDVVPVRQGHARALHGVEDRLQHGRLYLRLVLRSQQRCILRRGGQSSLTKLTSWRCLGLALRLLLRCQLPVGGGPSPAALVDHGTAF